MIRKEEMIKVGQFMKPHGVKGEIALMTDYDLFAESPEPDLFLFCEIDGILVPFFVEGCRPKSDAVTLIKLQNVDTEAQAAEFANLEVYYPKEAMDSLPNEVTWRDLIGYHVVDEERASVGIVTDIDESTMNVLLRIETGDGEFLLPAVEELIRSVDPDRKELSVSLPEGLLNL